MFSTPGKSNFLLTGFLCLMFHLHLFPQWQQKPDFPGTARDDGTTFVINNKAYCVAGLEIGWACTRDGAVFDGASETWSTMLSLPVSNDRQYSCSFSHGGYGYLFGGVDCSGNYLKDLWRYNPVGNSWHSLVSIPDSGRSGASCFVIHDTAYVVGGKSSVTQGLAEVWAYSMLSNTWTKKNNLPIIGCWRGNAFAIDTIGYLCFGSLGNGSYNHNIYAYNHMLDSWSVIPGIILPARNYVGSAVVNNKACMFGGADSAGSFANILLEFNPATQTITSHPGIPDFPRKGGMAFSVNNMFYYTTGLDSTSNRQKQTWRSSHVTGIKKENIDAVVNIFPNPAKEKFIVQSENNMISSIHIFNLLGEEILNVNEINNSQLEISTEKLVPGNYYLRIGLDNGNISVKKTIKL